MVCRRAGKQLWLGKCVGLRVQRGSAGSAFSRSQHLCRRPAFEGDAQEVLLRGAGPPPPSSAPQEGLLGGWGRPAAGAGGGGETAGGPKGAGGVQSVEAPGKESRQLAWPHRSGDSERESARGSDAGSKGLPKTGKGVLDTPSGKPKGQNERGEDAGVRQTPGLTTASRGPGRTEANSPDSCSPREEAPGLITGAKGVSRCTGLPVLSASDFPGAPAGKDPLVPARVREGLTAPDVMGISRTSRGACQVSFPVITAACRRQNEQPALGRSEALLCQATRLESSRGSCSSSGTPLTKTEARALGWLRMTALPGNSYHPRFRMAPFLPPLGPCEASQNHHAVVVKAVCADFPHACFHSSTRGLCLRFL
ncbi:unnamed protein product [Rangifer tarandus platyrhynchus]|uniref:Collagen alpha-1(I) chain-like n=2 Tax=Rangifer tarandus platyrhynchus TaxID=3082113 RepID=A0ABN8ZCE8_RANTA|nr:unnamed protein product [Rangifer tarandus platyrhynchus]CAI9706008.1 unnamed protein product [Rangifer tarandus platyrhynchus]